MQEDTLLLSGPALNLIPLPTELYPPLSFTNTLVTMMTAIIYERK